MRLPVGGINHLDFLCDLFDAVPPHLNAIAGLRVAVGGRLFKTDAPHLMPMAAVELDGTYVGSFLGIVPIAIRCLANLDQASRDTFVVIKSFGAPIFVRNRTSLCFRTARMRTVPDFLPVGERLPVEFARLITPHLHAARAGLEPRLTTEFHGATDLERRPLPMLRHADHVADHLDRRETRDQAVVGDLEGEILALIVGIKPGLAVCPFFAGLVDHNVILAADAIG